MRIALLTTARAWRGSGTSFTHIAQSLAARGHVLQLFSAAPAVTAELAARGLRARELPIRHSGFTEARALGRALDEFAAEVVIADKPRDLPPDPAETAPGSRPRRSRGAAAGS